ncbi:SDR family NAD(P)-dependent oxidoreductase [Streptomyces sp. NPDC046805]|uniref:SDR family NAD(P)-dependent oxidoreductase n=1 Tax=Streptomyces sp. NPDC046805 TaxID=3155134 RepID=UPI0033C1C5CA
MALGLSDQQSCHCRCAGDGRPLTSRGYRTRPHAERIPPGRRPDRPARHPRDTAKANPASTGLADFLVTRLDVTDPAGIELAVKEALDRFGAIDALVNAAGYGQVGAVEEVSADELRDQFETNVVGVVQVIQAVLPHMRERGSGHILNIGSMGGHVSLPTMAVYCASKSAVQNLTEGLAAEVGPLGIRVTLVEPAGFNTQFATNSALPAPSIPAYAPAYATMAAFDKQAVRSTPPDALG